ncbi:hypothetical protein Xcel_2777 [Xylanimonas cellulosilytica DSM 15894]|uniref:DUF2180 family protein n=1 Tax=Xylanimonas cellulosilytica (strain DSM 15894 / JCM 12276 / CECT 5975 / KCTC 9989 / LMG 20990 / NBRC 107835 / XIL07) TaxID=446471 RepID=D1BYB9_XYLCX|nr:hypothetical protein Xcel_2777 [Xylanimonas cellulosilytica DSM 15894]
MRCFDCASETAMVAEAAAVCAGCGAGLCVEHTLQGHEAEPVMTVGNPSVRRLPGRRLFCQACAGAYVVERAAAGAALAAAR